MVVIYNLPRDMECVLICGVYKIICVKSLIAYGLDIFSTTYMSNFSNICYCYDYPTKYYVGMYFIPYEHVK